MAVQHVDKIVVTVDDNRNINASIVAGSITKADLSQEVLDAIAEQYVPTPATKSKLGEVIVGSNIDVTEEVSLPQLTSHMMMR